MSDAHRSPATRRLRLEAPLELESRVRLNGVEIAYRTWGELSAAADNAVVVCHALTGSADADAWWAPLFGAGRALDPERDFIVCSNALGGCYGSTGPASLAPDGRPWGARFPRLTIRDQVRAQIALADALGIRRIRFVIGGSMGGLQALEWALLDRRRVAAVVSIAASAAHSPWCIAWSEAQRLALSNDPKYRDGDYAADAPPLAGMAAARAIAMIGYRSPGSLAERFARSASGDGDDFAVGAWLRHHGRTFGDRFDANSYRLLLDAMDSHDLARGRGKLADVLAGIGQPVLVGSIRNDALYAPQEQWALAAGLARGRLFEIDSAHGHDGFLLDAARVEVAVRGFIGRVEQHGEAAPSPRVDAARAFSFAV